MLSESPKGIVQDRDVRTHALVAEAISDPMPMPQGSLFIMPVAASQGPCQSLGTCGLWSILVSQSKAIPFCYRFSDLLRRPPGNRRAR